MRINFTATIPEAIARAIDYLECFPIARDKLPGATAIRDQLRACELPRVTLERDDHHGGEWRIGWTGEFGPEDAWGQCCESDRLNRCPVCETWHRCWYAADRANYIRPSHERRAIAALTDLGVSFAVIGNTNDHAWRQHFADLRDRPTEFDDEWRQLAREIGGAS